MPAHSGDSSVSILPSAGDVELLGRPRQFQFVRVPETMSKYQKSDQTDSGPGPARQSKNSFPEIAEMPQTSADHSTPKGLFRFMWAVPFIVVLSWMSLPAPAVGGGFGQDHLVAADRPLTVADSINMTRLVDLDNPLLHGSVTNFNFSLDGRHFFVVTRKGSVRSGVNVYELKLYDVSEVIDFVNTKDQENLPTANVLVRLETTSNHGLERQHAIREARWLSDETVAFIGDTGDGPGQVISVDIGSGKQKQLTHHDRNILFFDIDDSNTTLLYLSTLSNYDEDQSKANIAAGIRTVLKLSNIDKEDQFSFKYRLFQQPLRKETTAQPVGASYSGGYIPNRRFWLSPDGSKAVAVMPYGDVPTSVYEYYKPIANNYYVRSSIDDYDSNITVPNEYAFFRFVLIDIRTGETKEIFEEAPTGYGSGGQLQAVWQPDGSNVILATTFLPKSDSGAEEWERRRRSPAIVNYNVLTKRVTRIAEVTVPEGEARAGEPFYDISIDPNGLLTIRFRKLMGGSATSVAFKPENGGWASTQDPKKETHRLALSHRQDLTSPPEILAKDVKTGRQKIITDLNPEFRQYSFGRVEPFGWIDSEGLKWQGALIYPPTFQVGKRYPLVIQTHGFFGEDIFLIDGSFPVGPYAAQALANKGMLVLQSPDKQEGAAQRQELLVHRRGIEAAIDTLDVRGLIDKKRVGIMGYSRSGFYVDHVITFSDYDFAAALITDGSHLNFGYYTQFYGLGAPGMKHIEDMLGGATPWGDSLPAFVSRTTTFNLDKVKTPLRLERYLDNRNYAGYYWDQYVLMRRLHKPVELMLYPRANHTTINPTARMASAGGSVDWFAFWLKDEEDPDPAKAEQYERWRMLREQQKESIFAAATARRRTRQGE